MEIQMRLHRKYGPGFGKLMDPKSGSLFNTRGVTSETDPATDGVAGTTEVVNGQEILTTDWKSFPLGVVLALQYNEQTLGKCFTTTLGTVELLN
jgi:hypothetical protein